MTATKAQLRRKCCARTPGTSGDTRRAHWELYIAAFGTADWPTQQWPVARRHTAPTVQERIDALAGLGYQPAPDAEWEWQEGETPAFHGHPVQVSFLGTITIVPLTSGRTA